MFSFTAGMKVNTKYVNSTRGAYSLKKKKHSHCSPTCREKTLQVSSPLPHKHTRTSILQLQLSCMLSSDMTRICELIVSAPVYDGYVWLGVEISNNSQLRCKTSGGRCLVLHRTPQLQRELCLLVSVSVSMNFPEIFFLENSRRREKQSSN